MVDRSFEILLINLNAVIFLFSLLAVSDDELYSADGTDFIEDLSEENLAIFANNIFK